MPVHVTYPGVYIEEIPSTVKTVPGVSTSTTAFVDYFSRGPMSTPDVAKPVQIFSYRDFTRTFGGLDTRSEGSYAAMQFFNNGGSTAWVVRVDDGSGLEAMRKVPVNIPYLDTFARDALDEARKAQDAARKAQNLMDVVGAVLAAGEAKTRLPALAPGAAAKAAEADLRADKDTSSYKQLAGMTTKIERTLDAAGAAVDAAEDGEAKDGAASALLDAREEFHAVDLRADPEELKKDVERSKKSALAAAKAAGAAAEGTDKYEDGTAVDIAKVLGAAEESNASLRRAYYAYGRGAGEAGEKLEAGKSAKETAGRVRTALDAINASIDLADKVEADTLDAKKKAQQATVAFKALKALPTDAEEDKIKAASDAAVAATKAAATAAQAVVPDTAVKAPGSLDDPKKLADLIEAIGAAEEQAKKADGVLEKAGGGTAAEGEEAKPADPVQTTKAIQAASDGVDASFGAYRVGLKLIPKSKMIDDSGWPDIALVAKRAADRTWQAAEATQRAAEATDAASKVLAERVLEFEAAHGAIAEKTQDAADRAAEEAGEASAKAFDAAGEAKKASQRVDIDPEGKEVLRGDSLEAAKKTITDAAEAAQEAAEAAAEAADAAGDAHMAALEAGEAGEPPNLKIAAMSPGEWGNSLRAVVLNGTQYKFDIEVREYTKLSGKTVVANKEIYRNLTLQNEADERFALKVVNHESKLVTLSYKGPIVRGASPQGDGSTAGSVVDAMFMPLIGGRDGNPPRAERLCATMRHALEDIAPSSFNLLSLPITATYPAGEANVAINNALGYCEQKRAFMIVDIPETVRTVDDVTKWMKKYGNATNDNGAVYFPRLSIPDPLNNYRPKNVAASGTMTGVYARTDTSRGIWKAPAGTAASLVGAEVVLGLHDHQAGQLNPLGINALRAFPVYGNVAWGARTLAGADALQSEWKYINVRRLVYHIEESLFRALKWAVFEPNAAPLWSAISMQVGSFLAGLFASGAFSGGSPGDAYFVNCDATTTTADDIERGIVNIVIGIAPTKPAEFIILHIEQLAGKD
ncbi:MAG: hypothetical protein GY719_24045 [bacterium]|nr:hypothetical protein [bacterium]